MLEQHSPCLTATTLNHQQACKMPKTKLKPDTNLVITFVHIAAMVASAQDPATHVSHRPTHRLELHFGRRLGHHTVSVEWLLLR